jgi:hypothetical protein
MLPPPNWSPTGNSGTWYWYEQGEKDPHTGKLRGCWRFHDDVYGRVVTDKDLIKAKAITTAGLKKTESKTWIDKLKFWKN